MIEHNEAKTMPQPLQPAEACTELGIDVEHRDE
jgi:hypothetical protein